MYVTVGSLGYLLEAPENYVPSKGTLGHWLVNQRDKKKGVGYYALKGLDKVMRPAIHVADYIGTAWDWAGDQLMKTRIGRKAHEYVFDPEGKHPFVRAAAAGVGSYALNRYNRKQEDKMRLPQYRTSKSKIGKGIDAFGAGLNAYGAAAHSLKRGAMSKERLARVLANEKAAKERRRQERRERMDNFWNDMTY